MMTKTARATGQATSIIKAISKAVAVIGLVLLINLPITAFAAQEHLVTLLLVPDGSFDYTDYDSAYLTIISNKTGKSYRYTLYPYNNFSDKVSLPEGEYTVVEVGMNGRADIIFEFEAEDDIVVNRSVAIIVKFGDSKIIKQNTTTATTTAAPTTTQATETTKPEIPTLFSVPGGDVILNTDTTEAKTTTVTIATTAQQETTTAKTDISTIENSGFVVPVAIVLVILTIVVIAFFIALRKKNKEN